MRLRVIAVLLVILIMLASGCAGLQGVSPHEGKARIVLKLTGEPEIIKVEDNVTVPEMPAEILSRADVLYTNDTAITGGKEYLIGINYYTTPAPEGFENDFIRRLKKGTVIGVNDYTISENSINVSIGNTPDWEKSIFIIEEGGDSGVKPAQIFRLDMDLFGSGVKRPSLPDPLRLSPLKADFSFNPFSEMLSDGFIGGTNAGGSGTAGQAPENGAVNDTITYMNLMYTPYNVALLESEKLYYTGRNIGDKMIYVAVMPDANPSKVPETLFLMDEKGDLSSYLLAGTPPVYAYTLFGSYGLNETVAFGIMNDHGDTINLRNAAPWKIQRMDGGNWDVIYSPIAAQVITPVDKGSYEEWTWDQKLDDGRTAPPGSYRVVINDEYVTEFNISAETPIVESSDVDYDRVSLESEILESSYLRAFGQVYDAESLDEGLVSRTISLMQYKAWARGLDPEGLLDAINSTGFYKDGSTGLPSMAKHASYNGEPAWIIVFSKGEGRLSDIVYFVIDDAGNILDRGT